ncbi:LacI family DNA-binding transcriptional regulator [Streptomyces sp. NPDC055955]|uniref:LacI family DNA-binding transcriptional regulator n=1 Tax=Streptomyces sp. NPDC055955 TaxID=3345665 RepID=UPI0035E1D438
MSNSRVSLRWVAQQAGVSPATVSRVSRGSTTVSPELREKVLRIIEESGYRPNHLGRALAETRHGALGLVFPGLSGPYFSELLQGFEQEVQDSGDSMFLLASHSHSGTDTRVIDLANRVDGLAILAGTVSDAALEQVASQVRLVVMCARERGAHSTVTMDNTTFGTLARHLLVEHGYRRLAFVGKPEGSPDVTSRWEAFLAAHRDAGVVPPAEPVRVGLQQSDGIIAAQQILDGGQRPDAVMCANDETALGLVLSALGRGLRVPHDLAVTGFDDMEMAAMVRPGLTTVRQPIRELATTTARLLADRESRATRHITLPTRLVLRESCGCRPAVASPLDD